MIEKRENLPESSQIASALEREKLEHQPKDRVFSLRLESVQMVSEKVQRVS